MQNYAIIQNDIITKFPADPVRENPNTSFAPGWQGGTINGTTYVLVEVDNAPEIDPLTQDATPLPPTKINGKWVQKYSVVNVPAPEQQKRKAEKQKRDQEISDSFLTPDEIRKIRNFLKTI